jgi:protein-export membrane protein SecD
MSRHYIWLLVIILIGMFALWVVIPGNPGVVIDINNDGEPEFSLQTEPRFGLDIVGGLRVLLQAEVPEGTFSPDDLSETANSVTRRVNGLGLTEATVQVLGGDRILVELPGVTDRQVALDTIQQTALLEFVDFSGLSAQAQGFVGQRILTDRQLELNAVDESQIEDRLRHPVSNQPFRTIMTGAGLQSASAVYDSFSVPPEWQIAFEVKPEFQADFAIYTGSQIGEPMAIVLDGMVLSAPVIRAELSDQGVISGSFTEDEARTLALQLRSGALPIPLSIESISEVGATLGQESINLSVRAGVIGVMVVFVFMLVYYRVLGIAADLALVLFILINLALFELIPVTLTLPAITGFLISIGTAVDGNILIFERIKEERRAGQPLDVALERGFDRAWTSIRDSNFSTMIIAGILFLFGQTPGASIVSGFAITLIIGLIVNLFTAVFVTRTLLYIIVDVLPERITNRLSALGA